MDVREIATGLAFPEGPVALSDGSFLVVEIRRGTLTRVTPDGGVDVVADLGGGPNGAAIGPDGAVYVCNNGGFTWTRLGDIHVPLDLKTGSNEPPEFGGGWIERVDLATGASTVLYRECDGHRLCSPNDIVFDATGGFWFTDLGKTRARDVDRGGLYYAQPDGSSIVEAAYGLWGPNGVGLSPGGDRVYVAESFTGRLVAWDLDGPGRVRTPRGTCVAATRSHFDSLAVEADGTVVAAALPDGLCAISPDGARVDYTALPDPLTTNVCFAGDDARTAYVTLSGTGRLVALDWPRPGLRLAFNA
ncbi:MAG TPA: SMP-30/gluconolactonase/LRE family protein [Acidimicrobiia bacterium]|nr:SMP-30/gluconolactonase/LRE family protein [Acidimicrobiia bacterium]